MMGSRKTKLASELGVSLVSREYQSLIVEWLLGELVGGPEKVHESGTSKKNTNRRTWWISMVGNMKFPFGGLAYFQRRTVTFTECNLGFFICQIKSWDPIFFQAEHRQLILDFRLEAQCFSDLKRNPQKFSREEHTLRFFLVKGWKKVDTLPRCTLASCRKHFGFCEEVLSGGVR